MCGRRLNGGVVHQHGRSDQSVLPVLRLQGMFPRVGVKAAFCLCAASYPHTGEFSLPLSPICLQTLKADRKLGVIYLRMLVCGI